MFITKKIFFLIVQFARQHTSKSSFPAAPKIESIKVNQNKKKDYDSVKKKIEKK